MNYPDVPKESIELMEQERQKRIDERHQLALRIQAVDDGFCPMCRSRNMEASGFWRAHFTGTIKYKCHDCGYQETFGCCE